ncbi:MAG: Ig-like domain-containing protein [Coriobacteriia bacterium]|nr:Ig-like domain-containing protein [Coriobacteriia bacterium]
MALLGLGVALAGPANAVPVSLAPLGASGLGASGLGASGLGASGLGVKAATLSAQLGAPTSAWGQSTRQSSVAPLADDQELSFNASTGELTVADGVSMSTIACPGEGVTWSSDGSTLYLNNFYWQSNSQLGLKISGPATIVVSGDNAIVSDGVQDFGIGWPMTLATMGIDATDALTITGTGTLRISSPEAHEAVQTTALEIGGTTLSSQRALTIDGPNVICTGGDQYDGPYPYGSTCGVNCGVLLISGGSLTAQAGQAYSTYGAALAPGFGLTATQLDLRGGTLEAIGTTSAIGQLITTNGIDLPGAYTWWASPTTAPPVTGTPSLVAPYTYNSADQYVKLVAPAAGISVQSIEMSLPAKFLLDGSASTLSVTFDPPDATDQDLTWTSSDEGVVTVGGGISTYAIGTMPIHAVGPGTATVTATSEDGAHTATCTVTVLSSDQLSDYGLVFDPVDGILYVDTNDNGRADPGVDIVCPGQGSTWTASGPTLNLTGFAWQTSAPAALTVWCNQSATPVAATIDIAGDNSLKSTYDANAAVGSPGSSYTYGISGSNLALTISGDGTLDVQGGVYAADTAYGIYALGSEGSGLTVDGGTVTVTAGGARTQSFAAFVLGLVVNDGSLGLQGGTSLDNSFGVYATTTTVNGGSLNAVGGQAGDGGSSDHSFGIQGNLTVNGGSVTALGGAAPRSCGVGQCQVAAVNGGTLTATGGPATIESTGISSNDFGNLAVRVGDGTLVAQGQTDLLTSYGGVITLTPPDSYTWWASDQAADPGGSGTFYYPGSSTAPYVYSSTDKFVKIVPTANPPYLPVTEVRLSDQALGLTVGDSQALVAEVVPANASDPSLAWSSSDPGVATVDADGNVTALAVGTTTVTATSNDSGEYGSCLVTVSAAPALPVAAVIVTTTLPDAVVGTPYSQKLAATGDAPITWALTSGTLPDGLGLSAAGVIFGSATAVGTATFEVTATNAAGSDAAALTLAVTDALLPPVVAVSGVSLNKSTLALASAGSGRLAATVAPAEATDKTVAWTSDNPALVAVDANGRLTASATQGGSATITATTADGGFTATCTVTVQAPAPKLVPVTGITMNKQSVSLTAGQTMVLAATLWPANATNKKVTWSSTDTHVATVDAEGNVTAVGAGTAKILATSSDGGWVALAAVTVASMGVAVNGVTLDQASLDLTVGDTARLTATVSPADASSPEVAWMSDNEDVATVDAEGNVTAVGAGTATVTATATATTGDGVFTAMATVTVSDASAVKEATQGNDTGGGGGGGGGNGGNAGGGNGNTTPVTGDLAATAGGLAGGILGIGLVLLWMALMIRRPKGRARTED